ncbi:MAG: LPS-assembly protein LptD [Bacteroidales bacterium]|nr:LPS-assembly protein LptD [Bacteroidales bacterium]
MVNCKVLISTFIRTSIVLFCMMAFLFSAQAQRRVQASEGTRLPTMETPTAAAQPKDTAKTSSTGKSDKIEDIIQYRANDSIILLGNGTAFLYGDTEINYQSINLKADFVKVKIDSSLIHALGTESESGEMIGEPVFSEGEDSYNSKELRYNLRTKKGYIRHVVTQEGEGYIISEDTKKSPDNIFSIKGGKYTTCDSHENPHFYLSISKGKIKPGAYIVTGPAHLVVEDVPLPIALPFGFFPFTDKYSSGVLMPSYTDEMTRGFGLTNGGYYFAISDYMDLEMKGDIYTKGTWALSGTTNYVKKYKFRGSLGISYREDVTGEKGLPDYNKANNMSIRWSHSQDQKANPNFTFSSSVNFATSGYNKSNVNAYYRPELNSENTKSSSITFTKRFARLPSFSLSGGINVSQRTKDSTINMSLPNLNISYSRFYPLKRKNPVGKERWYEKISMSYSGAFANSIQTKENQLLSSSFTRDWRNGMKHTIPISASFNILKHINISPSFNYTERWYLRSVKQSWDEDANRVLNDTTDGFYRVFDFNTGISASTKLYGFFIPIRSIFGDKVDRIRHVLTPSIGFSYKPDFGDPRWGYYDTYMKGDNAVIYSKFAGSLHGTPSRGTSGSINFSLGNNIEMKLRNDKDTTGKVPFKKISIIDNLSASGSYNLAADSMRWSMFSSSIRLKLPNNYSLSLSASFDPYMFALNSAGNPVRVNQLRWNHGKFPRFQGTSTSYSYTFNNETFNKLFNRKKKQETPPDTENEQSPDDVENPDVQPGGKQTSKQTGLASEDGYTKISIPWSLSINYSVRFGNTNVFNKEKMEYEMDFMHNFSLNGSISLTPHWQISGNSSYDFKAKQFTYTSISVRRDLHCWNMSANIVPFGVYKSYNFHIGVNASMLSDLKYDKRSEYGVNKITWY